MKKVLFDGQDITISYEDEFILTDSLRFDVDDEIQRILQWSLDQGHPLMWALEEKCRAAYAHMRGLSMADPAGEIKVLETTGKISPSLKNGKLEQLGGQSGIVDKKSYIKALVAQTDYKNCAQRRALSDINKANESIAEQEAVVLEVQTEKDEADLRVSIAAGETLAATTKVQTDLALLKMIEAQNMATKTQTKLDCLAATTTETQTRLTKGNSDLTTADSIAATIKTKLLNM